MSAFGGGFGQPSSGFGAGSSAFGAPSAFGQSSQSAFGAAPSFGGGGGGGLFGQSSQQNTGFGAFGQSSAPFGSSSVFGAAGGQSSSAFGASGAFGSSVFGSQNTGGFGGGGGGFGASQSAFGSGGSAFGSGGSSLFGSGRPPTGGGFGSSVGGFGQSQSAWGSGASSSAFGGSSAFGASSGGGLFGGSGGGGSLFGNQSSAFGGSQSQMGTKHTSWQVTVETEGNPSVVSKYHAISMMPAYREKSLEELRVEDYAAGNKGSGSSGGTSLFGQSGSSLFGSAGGGGGFGSSGAGFGGGSGFGAQQNQSGFGASSGGGLFGGSSGFGNTGAFGQSSAAGFGSSSFGAQGGGGLFGQSSSGFNSQSGSAFGGGSSGFGGGGSGFGGSGSGFGGGGSGFGASSGGFGSSSFGAGGFGSSGSGFGGSGFGGSGQSGGSGLFGQSGSGVAFGAPQSQQQPSLFGSSGQGGGGLFGSSGGPSGGSGFGGFGSSQPASNPFGGGSQQTLFGGSGSGAGTGSSLFGSNTGGHKPLFGASSGGFGFGAPSSGGNLFGSSGNVFGQSAPATGTGFGGAFGAQPGAQQTAGQSLFGNPGVAGQVGTAGQGIGQNPSLLNTENAVLQGHGGTVAPSGANYGTVLHNLQKLQGQLSEQRRLLEEQAKSTAGNAQQPGSLSVVVLPSPPLVRLSAKRWSAGHVGSFGAINRTKMRSVVAKLGGATNKVSGTPLKLPAPAPNGSGPNSTSAAEPSSARKTPFFSPQQFTGPKRRPLRSAEIQTPHRSTSTPLPIPGVEHTGTRAERANGTVGKDTAGGESDRERRKRPENDVVWSGERKGNKASATGRAVANDIDANGSAINQGPESREDFRTPTAVTRGPTQRNAASKDSNADFMWSSPRPSSWSLRTPVDSIDQYDPDKYLPYLTREGFYTVPSMAELASKTMKDLQNVENFTIGRKGYGEVKWIEPVDVRGLDLDVVVDIQRGEIAVFPDRDANQLDAPAIVTLEGMYKKDKRTGTPTSDAKQTAKYAKKLEMFCDDNGLRFIDYSPTTGQWRFEAPGFSDE